MGGNLPLAFEISLVLQFCEQVLRARKDYYQMSHIHPPRITILAFAGNAAKSRTFCTIPWADHNLFHVIYFTLPESWSNVGSS